MRNFCLVVALGVVGCVSAGTALMQPAEAGQPRHGSVTYLNEGADFVVSERRVDARRKMTEACGGGAYREVQYSDRDVAGGALVGPTTGGVRPVTIISSNYVTIHFECVGH